MNAAEKQEQEWFENMHKANSFSLHCKSFFFISKFIYQTNIVFKFKQDRLQQTGVVFLVDYSFLFRFRSKDLKYVFDWFVLLSVIIGLFFFYNTS